MINKRLINTVPQTKKHIALNVVFQWISLICNIVIMFLIGFLINNLVNNTIDYKQVILGSIIICLLIIVRFVCTKMIGEQSFLASKSVKITLREMIYKKLLKLGTSYTDKVCTAEVVQASVEGVEQLETYFGSYLPQFFYSMIAPITLFVVLSFVSFKSAVILLICVPLIPVSIVAVQKFAKKLLAKYWGQYTKLGDSFLENLQGLTTLKIYQSDDFKHTQMNEEAEQFRKITMKVLTMQLNSITIMDLIAYGGAALGVVVSALEYSKGNIEFWGCFVIIMLSAEFFLPMRILGSYFHIAMNGMAASEKIFKLLDIEVPNEGNEVIGENTDILAKNLSFSYDGDRKVLDNVNLEIPKNSFVSIVGESGCGKSTIASIINGQNKVYDGYLKIGNIELSLINENSLMEKVTLIGISSYIFKGTVRDNLQIGKRNASDSEMWSALKSVNLDSFIKSEDGLDTQLLEKGSNFSGGQCQRLAIARALLHDSEIYIFDEATSNIDVESENDIMNLLHKLTKTKSVILISHRLANVVDSDNIYVLDKGKVVESGTHEEMLKSKSNYYKLWEIQKELEQYVGGEAND